MKAVRSVLCAMSCALLVGSAALDAQDLTVREKAAFEVASIKPNGSTDGAQKVERLPGGRLEITNMTLRTLLRIAYGGNVQSASQIVGVPPWAVSDGWDIVAKADGGEADRLVVMLRSLLEDRFKVRVHIEMREAPVYALTLANKNGKLGPTLSASHVDCSPTDPPPAHAPVDPARSCGIRGGNGNVTYTGMSLQQIATNLAGSPSVSRPVIDRTGLTGPYDFHLEFVPTLAPAGPGTSPPNSTNDPGSNLFTALVEQGGLKLQPERASVEFVVVDHAERPAEE